MDPLGVTVELPLAGRPLSRCCVDSAVGLHFLGSGEGNGDFTIRIEGKFRVGPRSSTRASELDPGERGSLGPVLGLVGLSVTRAAARPSGDLELVFADETVLRVPSDPQFEAWEVAGPHGLLLISTAGGGLTTWGLDTFR